MSLLVVMDILAATLAAAAVITAGGPAPAGGEGIRIGNFEASTLRVINIIYSCALQVLDRNFIDQNFDPIGFGNRIFCPDIIIKCHSILNPRAASAGDIHPQGITWQIALLQ